MADDWKEMWEGLLVFLKLAKPSAIKWIKSFSKSNKTILILGSGGVGKTSLGKLLSMDMSLLGVTPEYKESLDTEELELPGTMMRGKALVLAGQKHRRESTWKDPMALVQSGEIDGIIVVNSYGYHSLGLLGLSVNKTYLDLKNKGEEDQFLIQYLEEMKKREIDALEYLKPFVKNRGKPVWVLSVITKEVSFPPNGGRGDQQG